MMRRLAMSYGRQPPACRYATDLSKHIILGDGQKTKSGVGNAYLREARQVSSC